MAPREPEDITQQDISLSFGSEENSESDIGVSSNFLNHVSQADIEDMEQEYHTEESNASKFGQDDEQASDMEGQVGEEFPAKSEMVAEPPLLPAQLLKPLPSPAYSLWNHVSIPWDQMTRKQKKAERLRSRKAAKREWHTMQRDLERLQREAKDTGALEAGRIAQVKRGIVKARDKIKSGRVEKKTKPQVSGRQRLLQERKRLVELSGRELMRPPKKTKKKQPKR